MNINEEIKVFSEMLFNKYGTLVLDTIQVSKLILRSKISLERDRRNAEGIPYTKLGSTIGSGKATYNINDISTYIVSKRIKTA